MHANHAKSFCSGISILHDPDLVTIHIIDTCRVRGTASGVGVFITAHPKHVDDAYMLVGDLRLVHQHLQSYRAGFQQPGL